MPEENSTTTSKTLLPNEEAFEKVIIEAFANYSTRLDLKILDGTMPTDKPKQAILEAHKSAVTVTWDKAYDKGATDYHIQQLPIEIKAAEVVLLKKLKGKLHHKTYDSAAKSEFTLDEDILDAELKQREGLPHEE